MPRQRKGARLWLKPGPKRPDGTQRPDIWFIRDGDYRASTGCAAEDRELAEQKLAEYLGRKHVAFRDRGRVPSEIPVASVLAIYVTDKGSEQRRAAELNIRIRKLAEFWGDKTLADVRGQSCREYVRWRMAQPIKAYTKSTPKMATAGTARRELEDLRAAINYHRREGLCSEVVEVTLPKKPVPRERWLTRSEAAKLIWAAWRYKEQQQGAATQRHTRRHIARFILVGLYTGTRSSAILGVCLMRQEGKGYVDIDQGVMYRQALGVRSTKKRQPPVRLPCRLLAHIRRWAATSDEGGHLVQWNGAPVASVRKAFEAVVSDAGLGSDVTPHTLRHTCATWLMQAGVLAWDAAGYLGMSVQVLEEVYGHHHPDHLSAVDGAFGAFRNRRG
jgi:integrase